ncbi:hypothetical protein SEUCBS140593_009586 [Sporothrix eucalyptigena]|uniref:Major facilitator superfamily (MFS) profile domain-containing protein n=1 Tax=Sporothrix eucalyptigena TaxID=1812306 RepID=A0ABP0CWN5_9PEZI
MNASEKSDYSAPVGGPDAVEEGLVMEVAAAADLAEYHRLDQVFQGVRLFRVLPQLVFIYLLAYVDRSNIGNAKLFGAEADMHLSSQQWNTGLSVFFVTFSFFAIPSNMMLKRFGQKIWLPTLATGVGIIQICSGLQSSYAGWISFRLLLGMVEAGMYSGCTYTLTTWYSPKEIHTRMTVFYSAASLSGAFSGLLAYGIGQLDYTWGYRGWRFIYVIEGLLTTVVGILAYFVIYTDPARVGAWLDDDERRFLALRHRFAAGNSKTTGSASGIAEQEEGVSAKHVRAALKSFHVWAVIVIMFMVCVIVYGVSFVLPTIIANLGYTAANAQAMTVPPYVFAALCTVAVGWLADRYEQRMLSVVIPLCFAAIGCAMIMAAVRFQHVEGVTLLGCFIMAGGIYPITPTATAWIALNIAGSTKRAVAISSMACFTGLGGIIGSNVFLAWQAPEYTTAFSLIIAMIFFMGIVWPIVYWVILKRINAKRAAMPLSEVYAKYTVEELQDMGDESPLFFYAT